MSPLLCLPTELLHGIYAFLVSSVDNKNSREFLLALCLSCRVLRNVAQNILYQSVNINFDDNGSIQPLWRFTEIISSQPRLANAVKVLSIQLNPKASLDLAVLDPNPASTAQQPDTTLLHDKIQRIWAYELLDVLLAQLPNVQTLHIVIHIFESNISCAQTSIQVLKHIQTLHSTAISKPLNSQTRTYLRHVEITHRKVQSQIKLKHCRESELSVFVLSWLESVCIRRRQVFSYPGGSLFPPDIASKLTNLELRECCINVRGLSDFLAHARSLKRFALVTIDPLSLHRGLLLGHSQSDSAPLIRQPTPMQILEALSPRKDTLENLEIDVYEWFQAGFEALWGHDQTDRNQRYFSFRHFKYLKVLNIEYERACLPSELPESLLALTLTHRPNKPCIMDDPLCYPRIEQSYRKLILENICPRLQYVKVGRFYPFRYTGSSYFDWRYISKKRWEAFVSCGITFDDPFHESAVQKAEAGVSERIQDIWWDVWWNEWLSASWPKDLKEDILKCLLRETSF